MTKGIRIIAGLNCFIALFLGGTSIAQAEELNQAFNRGNLPDYFEEFGEKFSRGTLPSPDALHINRDGVCVRPSRPYHLEGGLFSGYTSRVKRDEHVFKFHVFTHRNRYYFTDFYGNHSKQREVYFKLKSERSNTSAAYVNNDGDTLVVDRKNKTQWRVRELDGELIVEAGSLREGRPDPFGYCIFNRNY